MLHVLTQWSNFYMLTGSAAGALTGLMFVVITLVGGERRSQAAPTGISTFSTPTVAHFCAALLVSALLSAPWHRLVPPAVLLGVAGVAGIAYILHLMRQTRRLTTYTPDLEDWTWYTALPLLAYAAILGGAIALPFAAGKALFALAGGVLLLIFIGIRNAWDVVTYIAIQGPPGPADTD